MLAPCGVEIRVGQIWRKRWFGRKRIIVAYAHFLGIDWIAFEDGIATLGVFTNKSGGYRLVKDARE